jgi:hypothetical protein
MNKRSPPRLATWILMHFASDYRRDSLVGDLIEQYECGRTRAWYWKQVAVAFGVAGAKALLSAAGPMFRVTAESLAVAGLVSLAYKTRRLDAPIAFVTPTLIATIALLCLVVSVCFPTSTVYAPSRTIKAAIKRLLVACAVVSLSAATLTWAGTPSVRAPQHATAPDCAGVGSHR